VAVSGDQQLGLLANEKESVESQIQKFIEENQNSNPVKSLQNSRFSDELQQAYIFAYMNGITTKETIDEANLENQLTRAEMAKMMSEYAMKIL
jgi:hypothetical protein